MRGVGAVRLFLFAGMVALVSGWGATPAKADECDSVAKPKFTMAPPAADAGAAAAFSGIWSGVWTLQVGVKRSERRPVSYCGQLHVSVTGPQSANVAYCVSSQPELGMVAGCSLVPATIAGSQLTFTSNAHINYAFSQSGGSLTGSYARPGGTLTANTEFRKMQ